VNATATRALRETVRLTGQPPTVTR
jgi:hypothetical protein